jgi:hypothetical protein
MLGIDLLCFRSEILCTHATEQRCTGYCPDFATQLSSVLITISLAFASPYRVHCDNARQCATVGTIVGAYRWLLYESSISDYNNLTAMELTTDPLPPSTE